MTKANDAARARVADAERRARRKIKRLQKKGIRTGSITPFRDVDPSNTRALNSYHKQLEQFIHVKRDSSQGRTAPRYPIAAIGISAALNANGTSSMISIGASTRTSRF